VRRAFFVPAALAVGLCAASAALSEEPEVEGAIRYDAPAPEMKKLAFLLGNWSATETWEEPRRYKRPGYEGYPGAAGQLTRTVEEGPGGFSLVWKEEGRGPMGGYSAMAVLAWDPVRRTYVLDRVHSLFPGIVRLAGGFEKGDLVFRGEDRWTGEKRALVLRIANPAASGFLETLDAEEAGQPRQRLVTARFEKAR
jgi:hypothetical protein